MYTENIFSAAKKSLAAMISSRTLKDGWDGSILRAAAGHRELKERLRTGVLPVGIRECKELHNIIWCCQEFLMARDALARAVGEWSEERAEISRQEQAFLRSYRIRLMEYFSEPIGWW